MKKRILMLTANPQDTDELRLGEEAREIAAGLRRSQQRDNFEIITGWATRPADLQRALMDYRPELVHFSGHGSGAQGLALEDKDGLLTLVSTAALSELFELFRDTVECVVLNACYSEAQAAAICQHIDYVVGMNQAVGDRSAIEFATGFYDALGAGFSIEDAFKFGRNRLNLESLPGASTPVLKTRQPPPAQAAAPSPRLFISYKRGVEPDEPVALQLYEALRSQHTVFIDQTMLVGTPWVERIRHEIQQSDALVVLLSEHSVGSEMVQTEVAIAHEFARARAAGGGAGRPQILPVRLAYRAPFQYPLSVYLDPIHWAFWETAADTPRLIEEIQRAIAGDSLPLTTPADKAQILQVPPAESLPRPTPSAQPRPARTSLELPEGTMPPDSQLYVARAFDRDALETIQRQGVTLTIKGPRQMGKSSLLSRVMETARSQGKQVAFLDFQLFDRAALENADTFFPEFCAWLTDELDLEDQVEDYWRRRLSNTQRCTRYVSKYLLKALDQPLVLAMDEVECTFDTNFRSDFFGMLRVWHNNRATNPVWRQLDLALVTSTEPYQLIENLNQSPFNVGSIIELDDFAWDHVNDLNQRHGQPFSSPELQQLMALVNGHPYLVRKALYLVASDRLSVTELFAEATRDRGPFGDHLRYHLFRMYDKPELVQGLLQVIHTHTCPDERIFFKLRGAGLVRRPGGVQAVVPRCQLYETYFRQHLAG